ncbi:MAG: tetratricopeptide repeat protein [Nitrospirae bacterium]|nr:tetratricopeptide repeat protein [Nitrospirota bacterium]
MTRYRFVIPVIFIALSAVLIYSNTLSSPFHFDDNFEIIEYQKIRELSKFSDLEGVRFIGTLSFALNYYFGGLNVTGYHLVNIVIHIINGILVWWLITLTFRSPGMGGGSGSLQQSGGFIALIAALLFVAHPVQTQAVTYIVQRYTSLATLFYLLSVALFAKWRLQSLEPGSRFRGIYYVFSILAAVLAMRTKEISITLPFIILLYEFFFFGNRWKRPFFLIPFLLTLSIIPLVFINLDTDKPIGDIVGEVRDAAQETESISRGDYLMTQFRVIVTYIRLLVLPVRQNLDYDYPVLHSFAAPGVFLSFMFLLAIFGLAVWLFIRSRKGRNGYLLLSSFGIFWFFITLSVESGVIPIRDVIFEHRLYLPFAGASSAFCSAMIYGIDYWRRQSGSRVSLRIAVLILAVVTVLPLSVASYQRNRVWKDHVTLWRDVVSKSPLKARTHSNLAYASFNQGLAEEAVREYRTAIRLKPGIASVHNNLALVYYSQGRIDEAIEEYKTALRLKPEVALSHLNLGLAYSAKGDTARAIEEFTTAINLNPGLAWAHFNLGLAWLRKGHPDKAQEEFRTTIRLKPDSAEAYNNIGIIYANQGRIDDAIAEFRTALSVKPGFAEAENNLRRAYGLKKGVK